MNKEIKNIKIKELYNNLIDKKYNGNYEFQRWFSDRRLRLDYYMTYKALSYHITNINFSSYLEFGPGPGTWTKVFYRKNKDANFTLVDISEEMKKQFVLEMRQQDNIDYIVGDILKVKFGKSFDLFFSSRAIEYLEDKEAFFESVSRFISEGSTGVIVTKNPHFGLFKMKKDNRFQHAGQLSVDKMTSLLKSSGFKKVEVYPVIVALPFIDRFTLRFSEIFFSKIFQKKMNTCQSKFIESYITIFRR